MKQNKAFTLAELLIAMLIFGLIAVAIIPNVTNNAEKEMFATQLKKVQNDLQQAMLIILSQNQGTLRLVCSDKNDNNLSSCFIDEIDKKLEKNVKYSSDDANACNSASINKRDRKNAQAQACNYQSRKPMLINKSPVNLSINGGENNEGKFYAINLKNGATVSVVFNPACSGNGITDWTVSSVIAKRTNNVQNDEEHAAEYNDEQSKINSEQQEVVSKVCGYMEIDINAGKAPNTVGKDIHYYWIIDQDGIIPFGEIDTFTCKHPKNKEANNISESLGCTYRVLQKGKADYY